MKPFSVSGTSCLLLAQLTKTARKQPVFIIKTNVINVLIVGSFVTLSQLHFVLKLNAIKAKVIFDFNILSAS